MSKNCYKFVAWAVVLLFVLPQVVMAQSYVGPEKCLTCHNNPALGDKTGWRTSMMANGYSYVPDDSHSMNDLTGVVCDANENGVDDFIDGLDFNTISSAFDPFKPNAPILAYSAETGYTMTIGDVTHKVYMTYGGSGLYKQRYMLKINTPEGESNDYYISPIQYNEKTHAYVQYHANDWWDFNNNNEPKVFSTRSEAATNSRSLAKGCSGCHMTGLEVQQTADGEWVSSGAGVEDPAPYASLNNVFDIDGDGDLDQINTTCERCHGPGGDHAATGDKTKIINPRNLTTEQATNMCGMCHARGKSLPNHTFGYPFDDANLTSWSPGDLVADFYSDGAGRWPDGSSVQHHQQFNDFITTEKSIFQFDPITCYNCHDIHNTVKHHIRTEIVEEDSLGADLAIATENDNNTLCLACHATFGDFADIPKEWVADYANHVNDIAPIVSTHTHHPYDPEGTGASRCSKCHNPKMAKSAIAYDIHSHTFEVISPENTTFYQPQGGMPNSCAVSCHQQEAFPNFGVDVSNDDIAKWDEASDIALADTLMHYMGPGGVWWDTGFPLAVEEVPDVVPTTFMLQQNYPNPFNPGTTIEFDIPQNGYVTMRVYNVLGQKVATLVNKPLDQGRYSVTFDGSGLATGVYVYRLQVNDRTEVKKMVLSK